MTGTAKPRKNVILVAQNQARAGGSVVRSEEFFVTYTASVSDNPDLGGESRNCNCTISTRSIGVAISTDRQIPLLMDAKLDGILLRVAQRRTDFSLQLSIEERTEFRSRSNLWHLLQLTRGTRMSDGELHSNVNALFHTFEIIRKSTAGMSGSRGTSSDSGVLSVQLPLQLSGVSQVGSISLGQLWRTYLPLAVWMLRQSGDDPYEKIQRPDTNPRSSRLPHAVSSYQGRTDLDSSAAGGIIHYVNQTDPDQRRSRFGPKVRNRVMIGICGPAGCGKTFTAEMLRIVVNSYHAAGVGSTRASCPPSIAIPEAGTGGPRLQSSDVCTVLSMDAFHYSNARLDATPIEPVMTPAAGSHSWIDGGDRETSLTGRETGDNSGGSAKTRPSGDDKCATLRGFKGRLDTIDAKAFSGALSRVREGLSSSVYLPEYDRRVHDPVDDRVQVLPRHRVVIVEGLYLLVGAGDASKAGGSGMNGGDVTRDAGAISAHSVIPRPSDDPQIARGHSAPPVPLHGVGAAYREEWGSVWKQLDGTVFLHVPEAVRRARVVRRKAGGGQTELEAETYYRRVDHPTGLALEAGSGWADVGLVLDDTGQRVRAVRIRESGQGREQKSELDASGGECDGTDQVQLDTGRGVLFVGPSPALQRQMVLPAAQPLEGTKNGQVRDLGQHSTQVRRALWRGVQAGGKGQNAAQALLSVLDHGYGHLYGGRLHHSIGESGGRISKIGPVTVVQPLAGLSGEAVMRHLKQIRGLRVVATNARRRRARVGAVSMDTARLSGGEEVPRIADAPDAVSCAQADVAEVVEGAGVEVDEDGTETRTCITVLEPCMDGRWTDGGLRVTELVEECAGLEAEAGVALEETVVAEVVGASLGGELKPVAQAGQVPSVVALCGSVPPGCPDLYASICDAVIAGRGMRVDTWRSNGSAQDTGNTVDWVVMDAKGTAAEGALLTGAVDVVKCNVQELESLAEVVRALSSEREEEEEEALPADTVAGESDLTLPSSRVVRSALAMSSCRDHGLASVRNGAMTLHCRYGVRVVAITDGPREAYLFDFTGGSRGRSGGGTKESPSINGSGLDSCLCRVTVFRTPHLVDFLTAVQEHEIGGGSDGGGECSGGSGYNGVLETRENPGSGLPAPVSVFLGPGEAAGRKALERHCNEEGKEGASTSGRRRGVVPCGSPIGAGDAVCGVMCGGLAAGMEPGLAFKLGLAAGCASCLRVEMGVVGAVELQTALQMINSETWLEASIDGAGI